MDSYMISPGINKEARRTMRFALRRSIHLSPESVVEHAVEAVCDYFHIHPRTLKSDNRKRDCVWGRMIAIRNIKDKTDLSLKAIGALFGNRDHSTVIYNLNKYDDLLDVDRVFQQVVKDLNKVL